MFEFVQKKIKSLAICANSTIQLCNYFFLKAGRLNVGIIALLYATFSLSNSPLTEKS